MGLYIRDDRVRAMAKRIAEARHMTVTEAVRRALERDLAEIDRDLEERDRLIRESWARVDAMPHYDFDEDDMYDESGAPR
jgi:hypothetical protein